MDIFDIINEASQTSQTTGKLVFLISGIGVCFNFFISGYLPNNILDGMYLLLSFSFIGMVLQTYKYRKNPHLTNKKCPICQSSMDCVEIKCIDEFKKNCQFNVRLHPK